MRANPWCGSPHLDMMRTTRRRAPRCHRAASMTHDRARLAHVRQRLDHEGLPEHLRKSESTRRQPTRGRMDRTRCCGEMKGPSARETPSAASTWRLRECSNGATAAFRCITRAGSRRRCGGADKARAVHAACAAFSGELLATVVARLGFRRVPPMRILLEGSIHSGGIFASRTILANLARWAFIVSPICSGVEPTGS